MVIGGFNFVQNKLTNLQSVKVVGPILFSPIKSVVSLAQIISGFAVYIILKLAASIINLTSNVNLKSKTNRAVNSTKKFSISGITHLKNSMRNIISLGGLFYLKQTQIPWKIDKTKNEKSTLNESLQQPFFEIKNSANPILYALKKAFYHASMNNDKMKQLITKFPQEIKKTEINGKYGLGYVFCRAAAEGNVEGMKLIIDTFPNFTKNTIEDDLFGLDEAFYRAALNRKNESMKLIIEEIIKIDCKGHALCSAAAANKVEAMKLVFEKFSQEDFQKIKIKGKFGLGHAFCNAAAVGNIEEMMLIINNFPTFQQEIKSEDKYGLGYAFCIAAYYQNIDAMKLIIKNFPDVIQKIQINEEFGLRYAFCLSLSYKKPSSQTGLVKDSNDNKNLPEISSKKGILSEDPEIELINLITTYFPNIVNDIKRNADFFCGLFLCMTAERGTVEEIKKKIDSMPKNIKNDKDYGLGRIIYKAWNDAVKKQIDDELLQN